MRSGVRNRVKRSPSVSACKTRMKRSAGHGQILGRNELREASGHLAVDLLLGDDLSGCVDEALVRSRLLGLATGIYL